MLLEGIKSVLSLYSVSPLYHLPSFAFGLNIFYSGIKNTEKDWVRLKVRYYPLQNRKEEVQKQDSTNMNKTDSTNKEKGEYNPPHTHTPNTKNNNYQCCVCSTVIWSVEETREGPVPQTIVATLQTLTL